MFRMVDLLLSFWDSGLAGWLSFLENSDSSSGFLGHKNSHELHELQLVKFVAFLFPAQQKQQNPKWDQRENEE